jgi:long-subunit fatty acid transport protein
METADPGSGSFFIHGSNGDATISLNPAVDYFIANNVSVGGSVSFSYDSSGTATTRVGIGARAGYNLNLTGQVGFWPSLRLFAEHVNANHTGSSDSSFGVFAPFLYHLTPHFFLGAGPDFNLGLSGGSSKEYGIDFIIGGWI